MWVTAFKPLPSSLLAIELPFVDAVVASFSTCCCIMLLSMKQTSAASAIPASAACYSKQKPL
jgi:hypothetical protein